MVSTRNLKNYYTPDRRSGNSTRQTNFAIEELFKGKKILVKDHYGTRESDEHLLKMILTRLEFESKIQAKNIKVEDDGIDLTIQLLATIPY